MTTSVLEPTDASVATADDLRFMCAALRFSRRHHGLTWPNPCVAALIVAVGETGVPRIVGRGVTALGGRPHAERIALDAAGDLARGATCYVTLEPCAHFGRTPPCADALVGAGLSRVVTALEDPDPRVSGRGHARLREHGIAVVTDVARDQALDAHGGHIMRLRARRPMVTVKTAVSADGFISGEDRKPVAITSESSRAVVHAQRMSNDAVLTGIGTVLADDPRLTVRLPGLGGRSPARVVVDSRLRLPVTAKLVATVDEAPLWVYTLAPSHRSAGAQEARRSALRRAGVEIIDVVADRHGHVSLEAVLADLATRGVTRLYAEGGGEITAGLLDINAVDQIIRFDGKPELGGDGIPPVSGDSLDRILNTHYLMTSETLVGVDRMRVYKRAPAIIEVPQRLTGTAAE